MTRKILTKSLSKLLDNIATTWLNRDMLNMEKKKLPTFQEYQDEAERDYVMRVIVPRKERGMSLRRIGEEIGLSYEQVRQLLKKYGHNK